MLSRRDWITEKPNVPKTPDKFKKNGLPKVWRYAILAKPYYAASVLLLALQG